MPDERPDGLRERLEALRDRIRSRERDFSDTTVWACQSDSRWHADEFREWADELSALLRSVPMSPEGQEGAPTCPSCGSTKQERIVGLWLCNDCGHEWDNPSRPSTASAPAGHDKL
jgi:rubrerythrin